MHLTEEQNAIVHSRGNLKIHAVAGSGKTSTLVEYATAYGKGKRVLYLAFNRSVRLEAQRRFTDAGLNNVDVHTAHSLAYRKIVPQKRFKVRLSYKASELVNILGLGPVGHDPHSSILVAAHINRLCSYFCNYPTQKVQDLDYCSIVKDSKALAFVKKHYDFILNSTRVFLARMNSGEIPVTHEFYLKLFQMTAPQLGYDIILFDEGQDASPVMLDIFLCQDDAVKLIVGDVHQQIYGWRFAVNALQNVEFRDYSLTTSFRFPQKIADMAMECLEWKSLLGEYTPVRIRGAGKVSKVRSKATLARTNLGLLRSAIDFVNTSRGQKKVYFEGNFSSYTYAGDGASIWDVLNLYKGKRDKIRDPIVASMNEFDDLIEYSEIAEDTELSMLTDMVSDRR